MKKAIWFILLSAWVFSMLDWKVIELTRFARRDWLGWMHNHEREYAAILFPVEIILCTPAFALKPLFQDALIQVEATPAQIKSITHAPRPTLQGFYQPIRRGEYKFIAWFAWFIYWLAPSILWALVWNRLWNTQSPSSPNN